MRKRSVGFAATERVPGRLELGTKYAQVHLPCPPVLQRLADEGGRVEVRHIARGKAAQAHAEARKRVAERYAADAERSEEISEILAEIEIAAATAP